MSEFTPNYGMSTAYQLDYPIFIWHDGTPTELGVAVTAATITVTQDTGITMDINAAVDTRLGAADGIVVHGDFATWGLVAKHINAVKGWHCVLRDGHFDGVPNGWNTLAETSCLNVSVGVSVASEDDFQMGVGIVNYEAGTTMRNTQACLYYFTGQITSTNGAQVCQIFDCDDEAGTEQLVRQFTTTTATEHPYPTAGPLGMPVYVAKPGHRILVLFEGVDNLSAGRVNIIGGLRQTA